MKDEFECSPSDEEAKDSTKNLLTDCERVMVGNR